MSQNLVLEMGLAQLPDLDKHVVQDCAHQVQQLLARLKNPHLQSLALELASAQQQATITF